MVQEDPDRLSIPMELVKDGKAMQTMQETISAGFLIRCVLALLLAALLGSGCAAPGNLPQSRVMPPEGNATSPALTEINRTLASVALQAPGASTDYRLGPEDLLQITLFNVPESEAGVIPRRVEVRVSLTSIPRRLSQAQMNPIASSSSST